MLTYATPVGIRPDRLWCISLYRKTKSHANFIARKSGVLQLLTERHAPLTYLLGGQTGQDVDKQKRSSELGFQWQSTAAVEEMLLPGCSAYIRLVLVGDITNAGDHDVAICRLEKTLAPELRADKEVDDDDVSRPLMSAFLREKGLISNKGQAIAPEPQTDI